MSNLAELAVIAKLRSDLSLRDQEVETLKAEYRELATQLADARLRIDRDEEHISKLETALDSIGKTKSDIAVTVNKETPASTLCAICDQIKELHPNTHPWTAKETKDESKSG
jgi:chromosome segregation ATPase